MTRHRRSCPHGRPSGSLGQHVRAAAAAALLAACSSLPDAADPTSDAPEHRAPASAAVPQPPSYAAALHRWRSADDINAWIGSTFRYDGARALLLSETQRNRDSRLPIHAPEMFFDAPSGVCVDLARFAAETLHAIDPESRPAYVMIEFAPVTIAGNTLRRHWVVSFERDGMRYFFADSKRPGHLAGPYRSTQDFIDDYARYRGRTIVSYRELESYERKVRTRATRQAGATIE
jgi:hypothetical protein